MGVKNRETMAETVGNGESFIGRQDPQRTVALEEEEEEEKEEEEGKREEKEKWW